MRLLALLALLAACGRDPAPAAAPPPEPFAGSPLLGRWSGGARTLEFLADGTLVDLVEAETTRSTRQDDGTFVEDTVAHFRCHLGVFRVAKDQIEYELAEVASEQDRVGRSTFQVDGAVLSIDEAGDVAEFERDDPEVTPDAAQLVGLWRRIGDHDYKDMGVRFTPGGLAIIVGIGAKWGNGISSNLGWLAMFSTYEVREGTLHEVRPNSPDKPRARPFQIEGNKLTLEPRYVYERVRGVVPMKDGKLDRDAWKAMK